jgi:hypothetical protein
MRRATATPNCWCAGPDSAPPRLRHGTAPAGPRARRGGAGRGDVSRWGKDEAAAAVPYATYQLPSDLVSKTWNSGFVPWASVFDAHFFFWSGGALMGAFGLNTQMVPVRVTFA